MTGFQLMVRRKRLGYTQDQLGAALDVSGRTVREWESYGDRHVDTILFALKRDELCTLAPRERRP